MAMFHEIGPREFREKMEKFDDVVLIDVRTPGEIALHALEGHVAMDISDPSFTTKVDALDRNMSYFIYCRSGNRSAHACRYMMSQGFKKLYNLDGGIIAWEDEFE